MALKYLYVPSGVKAGTAYGVLPNSASADFSSFVSDTDGTRVDENGFITDVAANVPRLDYTGGGCPSLLLEPTSTNLIGYSEDFTQSSWAKEGNATIESDVEISPTGSLNASYLKAPVGTNISPRVSRTFGCASGQTYTGSVFVKKDNVDYIRLLSTGATASTVNAYYNVSNGTLGTSGSPNKAKIEDYGNGWYRLSLVINTTQNTGSATFRVQLTKGDGLGVSDFDGTEKNIIFGAQLEQQPYATSYIPNYGTAAGVTRAVDDAGGTGDISSAINEEEGVFFAYMAADTSEGISTPRWLTLSEGTSSNSFIALRYSNAGNSIQVRYRANGGTPVQISTTSVDRSNFNKIAFRWKENDFSLWINGVLISTQTTLDIITANNLNRLSLETATGGQNLYGKVKQIRIYDKYESNAEIEELTSWSSLSEMAQALNYKKL